MPWLVDDCIQSMGETDIPVLIVDNSEDREIMRSLAGSIPDNVSINYYGTNLGIAAGWNKGLEESADQTLIVSQTVRFAPAEHPRRKNGWGLGRVAEIIENHASPHGMTFGDQGYHLISIGKKTVEEIGYFDENFLAYGEDDDYGHRMNLAGISLPDYSRFGDINDFHSIAFAVQKRIPKSVEAMTKNRSRIRDYYTHKWGEPHPGSFKTPFNNPDNPLSYWPEVQHG